MKPINVGIIGAGYRGVNTLAERIVEVSGETGLRVTALCDTRADRVVECQAHLGSLFAERGISVEIKGMSDPDELIQDPDVDLVMVTTPQSAHRVPVVGALESGKRVYCDKPIAHTLEDAVAIIEAERRTGNEIILGFTRRYEAPWRKAFDLVKEGVIGDLHMMQIRDIIPFHTYFHRWHRRKEWSGRRSTTSRRITWMCSTGSRGPGPNGYPDSEDSVFLSRKRMRRSDVSSVISNVRGG